MQYSVTATIKRKADNGTWTMTGVYGPQGDPEKMLFLDEIRTVRQQTLDKWMILGDFNLIYRSCNKNNSWVNHRLMNRFRWVLDELELKELHLHGRHFTWTSETDNPTMTKIDHVFCTREWELDHPDCYLQAIGSSVSDHCPMILTCTPYSRHYRGFRFESFWLHQPGFLDLVQSSWTRPVASNNKARVLHVKLARLAKELRKWNRQRLDDIKQQANVAQQLVQQLDLLREQRQLNDAESSLRRLAKNKIVALASVRRIKIRQRSRLTAIRAGDANTRLFHLRANGRRRKNHIPMLQHEGTVHTSQQQKANVLHQHFAQQLGDSTTQEVTVNWDLLHIQQHDLQQLEEDVSVDEIKQAVMHSPSEKAPGPDRYIGGFFKAAWDVIKHDLVAVIQENFERRSTCWNLLNSANIALLPKKNEATTGLSVSCTVSQKYWGRYLPTVSNHIWTA